jgi:hypothetical protein
MIQQLFARLRRKSAFSVTDFTEFLERNAWLITQKSIIGYCHVKTKLPVHELMWDKPFEVAYEVSIRHAHAAALADLLVISLGYLKSAGFGHDTGDIEVLVAIFRELQAVQDPLPHGEPMTWTDETDALRRRLTEAADKPSRSIRDIASTSGERIFETLPFHPRHRDPDKPAVVAGVEFLMVGLAHEFERIDFSTVAAGLRLQRPS